MMNKEGLTLVSPRPSLLASATLTPLFTGRPIRLRSQNWSLGGSLGGGRGRRKGMHLNLRLFTLILTVSGVSNDQTRVHAKVSDHSTSDQRAVVSSDPGESRDRIEDGGPPKNLLKQQKRREALMKRDVTPHDYKGYILGTAMVLLGTSAAYYGLPTGASSSNLTNILASLPQPNTDEVAVAEPGGEGFFGQGVRMAVAQASLMLEMALTELFRPRYPPLNGLQLLRGDYRLLAGHMAEDVYKRTEWALNMLLENLLSGRIQASMARSMIPIPGVDWLVGKLIEYEDGRTLRTVLKLLARSKVYPLATSALVAFCAEGGATSFAMQIVDLVGDSFVRINYQDQVLVAKAFVHPGAPPDMLLAFLKKKRAQARGGNIPNDLAADIFEAAAQLREHDRERFLQYYEVFLNELYPLVKDYVRIKRIGQWVRDAKEVSRYWILRDLMLALDAAPPEEEKPQETKEHEPPPREKDPGRDQEEDGEGEKEEQGKERQREVSTKTDKSQKDSQTSTGPPAEKQEKVTTADAKNPPIELSYVDPLRYAVKVKEQLAEFERILQTIPKGSIEQYIPELDWFIGHSRVYRLAIQTGGRHDDAMTLLGLIQDLLELPERIPQLVNANAINLLWLLFSDEESVAPTTLQYIASTGTPASLSTALALNPETDLKGIQVKRGKPNVILPKWLTMEVLMNLKKMILELYPQALRIQRQLSPSNNILGPDVCGSFGSSIHHFDVDLQGEAPLSTVEETEQLALAFIEMALKIPRAVLPSGEGLPWMPTTADWITGLLHLYCQARHPSLKPIVQLHQRSRLPAPMWLRRQREGL